MGLGGQDTAKVEGRVMDPKMAAFMGSLMGCAVAPYSRTLAEYIVQLPDQMARPPSECEHFIAWSGQPQLWCCGQPVDVARMGWVGRLTTLGGSP